MAMVFNADIDVDVNILNRTSFDLKIKKDMPKKSISVKHELDAILLEYSLVHKNDGIVDNRTEYNGNDVFFSQLDYLHEFYYGEEIWNFTHRFFEFIKYGQRAEIIEIKSNKDETVQTVVIKYLSGGSEQTVSFSRETVAFRLLLMNLARVILLLYQTY